MGIKADTLISMAITMGNNNKRDITRQHGISYDLLLLPYRPCSTVLKAGAGSDLVTRVWDDWGVSHGVDVHVFVLLQWTGTWWFPFLGYYFFPSGQAPGDSYFLATVNGPAVSIWANLWQTGCVLWICTQQCSWWLCLCYLKSCHVVSKILVYPCV